MEHTNAVSINSSAIRMNSVFQNLGFAMEVMTVVMEVMKKPRLVHRNPRKNVERSNLSAHLPLHNTHMVDVFQCLGDAISITIVLMGATKQIVPITNVVVARKETRRSFDVTVVNASPVIGDAIWKTIVKMDLMK